MVSSPEPANQPIEPSSATLSRRLALAMPRAKPESAVRIVDAEEAPLIFLSREAPIRRHDQRHVRPARRVRGAIAVLLLVDEDLAADPIVARLAIHGGAGVERLSRQSQRPGGRLEDVARERRDLAADHPRTRHRLEVRRRSS